MRIFKLYLPFELFDRIKLMAKFYNLSISKMMKELLEIGYIEMLKIIITKIMIRRWLFEL